MSTWISAAFVVTTIYGILMASALLFSKRGNRRANAYLGCLLLLWSWSVVLHVAADAGVVLRHPHLFGLDAPFHFLYGPLVLFHIGSLTNAPGDWSLRRLLSRHSFGFAALVAYFLPLYFFSPSEKALVLQRGYIYRPGDEFFYNLLQNATIALYSLAAAPLFFRFRKRKADFSLHELGIYRWLVALSLLGAVVLCTATFQVLSSEQLFANWVITTLFCGLYLAAAYFWFVYPEVFVAILAALPLKKYQRSGLKKGDAEVFSDKLISYMGQEKPWLNANLSLGLLAESLNINPTYLSQIINERHQKTFKDFVNAYRVQMAKELLQQKQNALEVGFQVGFNSKSTFYAAFKKETGETPGSYGKSCQPTHSR